MPHRFAREMTRSAPALIKAARNPAAAGRAGPRELFGSGVHISVKVLPEARYAQEATTLGCWRVFFFLRAPLLADSFLWRSIVGGFGHWRGHQWRDNRLSDRGADWSDSGGRRHGRFEIRPQGERGDADENHQQQLPARRLRRVYGFVTLLTRSAAAAVSLPGTLAAAGRAIPREFVRRAMHIRVIGLEVGGTHARTAPTRDGALRKRPAGSAGRPGRWPFARLPLTGP